MSITDDARPDSRPHQASSGGGGGGFDKSPPQDIAAEQSVLGGMLLSKDAIADVVEILKSHDFYRPVHATVFDIILDLYGRGEPADGVTVAAALSDAGDLQRIGGVPYLHTLIESVPTAANAAYYARIVSERAVLRRLVEAGTKIVQLGYGTGGNGGRDVDDIVDLAQQAVYDVTERRVSEDFAILADMLQPTLDEIEAVGATNGMMTGVPTGFSDLDRLLNGLHPGQLIIVAGRPGLGKALALDTPLATPQGWTTMAEVAVGDRLLGADGHPTTVIATSEIMLDRPCYEVVFSDGSVLVADAAHQWSTHDRAARRRGAGPAVRTTRQLAETLHPEPGGRRLNHSVAGPRPIELPDRPLTVAPYTFGAWLGAGDDAAARIDPADPELVLHVEADGYTVAADGSVSRPSTTGTVTGGLRALGVLADRHIPLAYLRGSQRQRRALLAGLLDSGGTVTPTGACRFTAASPRLADDVRELLSGLGHPCTTRGHTIDFWTADDVFRLHRKALRHKERRRETTTARYIVEVRAIPSVPVKCVSIDNDDKLYLAGRAMIPTHNSTASMDFARNAAIRANCASAIFSLEMSKIEIVMRLLSAEARVPLHILRSGQLSDDDWTKLARRMGEISEAPIFVDDTPSMNLMEIRAKARRLKQRHNLKLIVVDYLQLMTSPKRTESRQQEVADLSRGLKLLAKEVECPVIAVSQLNRGPEQRTDKRPQLSDLRESGCLTAATRIMRADDNSEVTLGELLASGSTNVPVWALNERLQYTAQTMTHVFPSGQKPVYRLVLASGKEIEATANHPFLTYDGWRPLGELAPGDRLAVPRHVPPPLLRTPWPESELVMLAHLLGGGTCTEGQPIRCATADELSREAVAVAAKHFGVTAVRDGDAASAATTVLLPSPAADRGHPIAEWLAGLGLRGLHPDRAFLPERLFRLPKEQVALFLSHLWTATGSSTDDGIHFHAGSRRMLDGVARLLLRFGITARVTSGPRPARFTLDISGRDDQVRFLREIGGHGARAADAASLLSALQSAPSTAQAEPVPHQVWDDVRTILLDDAPQPATPPIACVREAAVSGSGMREAAVPGSGVRGAAACGSGVREGVVVSGSRVRDAVVVSGSGVREDAAAPGAGGVSRQRLGRVAAVLDTAGLELQATNDVHWEEITSIDHIGDLDVFDATVTGTHNFIANGVATHNSIEQDADVVILLHRDDYYDKESPRAGEADFIVAKHRNGPTDTVTVAAQLHLSRFVDMAIV